MIKQRIQEILIHPAFLSLIVWLVLVLVIPTHFTRYRIKHIADGFTSVKTSYFFSDLDSDGNSERISIDLNDQEQTKIIINKNDKILDQYDLPFQPSNINQVYIDYFNEDSFKECYVFTMNQDSIFLNIIDPIKSRKILLSRRFIDLRWKAQNSDDTPQIVPVGTIEGQNKGFKDFVFYISTGYSKQPRNVYRYLINEDSLVKSPESGATISGCLISDINGDSISEVILDLTATGNLDEFFPFTDRYAWLMILDHNLQFLFPPVKFEKNPSILQVFPFRTNNRTQLLAFYDYSGSDDIQSFFYLFDTQGNKIKEKPICDYEPVYSKIFPNQNGKKHTFFFLKNRSTEIVEIDSSFQEINTIKIPQIINGYPIAQLDADFDGKKELIFLGPDLRTLIFVRDNFTYPVSWQYNSIDPSPLFTQFIKYGDKPIIYVQFSDHGSYISYEKNPLYFLKYPLFLILYFTVYLFIFIIGHFQRYRLNMKKENEMKMVALQMKAIKNQIDPHFTLNVLNAIGSLYADDSSREKADYIFGKYAKLIRQTVITSDQVTVTIAEELDFVKNYIEIEKFRCGNSFNCSINIDKNSNMETKIPRTLIHTFVENAIKYSMRKRTQGGILNIIVQTVSGILNILIEDNGTGSGSNYPSANGTGKGLIILQELIDLFYRLENVKIIYTLQTITQEKDDSLWTKAIIKIPAKSTKYS